MLKAEGEKEPVCRKEMERGTSVLKAKKEKELQSGGREGTSV
jgi:hypothetical protein